MAWGFKLVATYPVFQTQATAFLATLTDPNQNQQATAAVNDSLMMATELYVNNGQPLGAGNVSLWPVKYYWEISGSAGHNNATITNKVFLNPRWAQQ